jgi:hypothetical protein
MISAGIYFIMQFLFFFYFIYALKTPYDHAGPKGTTELHPESTTIKEDTHTNSE